MTMRASNVALTLTHAHTIPLPTQLLAYFLGSARAVGAGDVRRYPRNGLCREEAGRVMHTGAWVQHVTLRAATARSARQTVHAAPARREMTWHTSCHQ
jgi:hypothetical protein